MFWIWKRILTHFSLSNCSSPSHDLQHHQKWFQTDLIQPFIIKHDFFTYMPYIKLVINIFVIFCHALFDFGMTICCNLGNIFLLFWISPNNFSKAFFSILSKLPAVVHWITTSPATLFDDWSRNEYLRCLVLCPGIFFLFIACNIHFLLPCSFHHASFATPKRYLLWM